jgi:hypothetical protein
VLNGGGSPGHVLGPVAGIVRAVVANAFVSQRLRPLPSRQNREELLAVTGLIEDGKAHAGHRPIPLHARGIGDAELPGQVLHGLPRHRERVLAQEPADVADVQICTAIPNRCASV